MKTRGLDPSDVAEMVVAAVRDNRFYVPTHPDIAETVLAQRSRWMTDGVAPQVPIAGRHTASA